MSRSRIVLPSKTRVQKSPSRRNAAEADDSPLLETACRDPGAGSPPVISKYRRKAVARSTSRSRSLTSSGAAAPSRAGEGYNAVEVCDQRRCGRWRFDEHQTARRPHRPAAAAKDAYGVCIAPVAKDVHNEIDVSAARHAGEEVSADEGSALSQICLREER